MSDAPPPGEHSVTEFLQSMERGDEAAKDKLWEAVYQELRSIAGRLMSRESTDHTLQPTALVHEAYARLLGGERLAKQNRSYFFAAAAQAMRRILIEHARRASSQQQQHTIRDLVDSLAAPTISSTVDGLNALDEALDALQKHNQRVFDVVMFRFFAGLSIDEAAEALQVSARTIKREWTYGRTWLYRYISNSG